MIKSSVLFFATLAMAGAGAIAGEGAPPNPLLRFDANSDGNVTRAEVDAGIITDFSKLDRNGDRKASAEELEAHREARRAEMKPGTADGEGERRGPPPPDGEGEGKERSPLSRLDWNLDGFVTIEEWAAPIRLMTMRADRDGNGTVSGEELKARPHGRGRKGHGHP